MSMFQKRTGTGVPYHLFARFVGVEGDRVIVEEAGTERIHKVLITNEKSPNIPHFIGKKKIGTTDLSMEEGGFIKFDGMKSLGDTAEANYATILIRTPGAVFFQGVPATVFSRTGKSASGKSGEEFRLVKIIDTSRSVAVKTLDEMKDVIAAIAGDDSLVRDAQNRDVMIRTLNPQVSDDASLEHFTFIEFGSLKDDDAPLAERAMAKFKQEGGPAAMLDGAPVEITPVWELFVGKYNGNFADDVPDPEVFLTGTGTKKKPGFVNADILARPFDRTDPSKGFSVSFCQPRCKPENIGDYLRPMTQVLSPALKNKDEDDDEDGVASAAAE